MMTTARMPDLIGEIHDLDEHERASAFKRWFELSLLVAPRDDDAKDREGT